MNVSLVLIDISDKSVLSNLLKEYELEMLGGDPGEYKYLDSYWEKENRRPFFIMVEGNIAGFVLINAHTLVEKGARNLAEFYVRPEYRHGGIGREAATQAFNLFPGKWEVRERRENPTARDFWVKVIGRFTNNNFREEITDNEAWRGWIQTFDSTILSAA